MNKKTKYLIKENKTREKEINKENEDILTNIILYLRGSDLSRYNQEMVRADLIDMIIEGQKRGDDIQKVIGENYKEICDEIINSFPQKTYSEKIFQLISEIVLIMWVIGIISVVSDFIIISLITREPYEFNLTVGKIISGILTILFAEVYIHFLCKQAFAPKKISKSILEFLFIWIMVFIISFLPFIFKNVILTIPLYIAAIIVFILFAIERIMDKFLS
ncbi:DUF1129 domain-containing protein [Anaerosacchariphilus polymeriproducens]|uniref:DUF1048 domain-containing protein n=1 Tax=Anaerosacchariphilus polymeriproducens TaxID=1812858 RepID=A0A371AV62_9FIRM|nr:hypothetical protein [Anaerosacchariphilus polymeriproducens]RDU23360.1 hypothetical protein DWV06_09910 [Anaerosacchariphilus polymeriproducens]